MVFMCAAIRIVPCQVILSPSCNLLTCLQFPVPPTLPTSTFCLHCTSISVSPTQCLLFPYIDLCGNHSVDFGVIYGGNIMKVRKVVKVCLGHTATTATVDVTQFFACFLAWSVLYVYIDRCDRGQAQEGHDLKTISGTDSGFAYFRVVFGVYKLSGLFPRCGIQGEINLHFDTYLLCRKAATGHYPYIVYFEPVHDEKHCGGYRRLICFKPQMWIARTGASASDSVGGQGEEELLSFISGLLLAKTRPSLPICRQDGCCAQALDDNLYCVIHEPGWLEKA
eukprot:g30338.t1